jgi:hypothetical protein
MFQLACVAPRGQYHFLAFLRTGYFGIVTHGVVWEMATELAFVTLESTLFNAKCSFETILEQLSVQKHVRTYIDA